ncbi:MAG: signal peptidase II [Bacilli bacterium]|nr:signal peptidase II [Bacilli bacterium]
MKKTALISIAVVAFDQIIKKVITSKLVLGESISIIKNILNITYVTNTGAAFSILSSNTYFLIMISLIVLTVLVLYLIKVKTDNNEKIIYGFLIGGIIGNLIDRIFNQAVIDYIDVNIFGYPFPVFNFADMVIVISILLIIIYKKDDKNEIQN